MIVAGDGPERAEMERLVAEHGLQSCVELRGQVPQAEVAALMREADIFAFPSIRELGAGVLIEAMACGMACVAVDYGGPGTLLAPDRGIKVAMGDKASIVDSFKMALERLADDPGLCERLGLAAHSHAMTYYTWDAKARKTLEVYDWVLGRRATKPDFWAREEIRVAENT